eukprot:scaffold18662_cov101-Skeletonema_dohrnii-CCMP3373.AAC.6
MAENSISIDELAEQNIDWYAAACIYVDETTLLPLEGQRRGFRGTVRLTIDVTNTAFCRKTSQDGHYRYFIIDKLPVLTVALDYVYNDLEIADDYEEAPPTNVDIQFEQYPEEWPSAHQSSHVTWLTEKCQQAMNNSLGYGSFTYEMIQLCEHELMNFWEVIHQTDDYRLILLPPKMDNLYHSNVGVEIHPRNEAIKLQQTQKQMKDGSPSSQNSCASAAASAQEYAQNALLHCWPKMYHSQCPICFDDSRCDEGTTLPCGDFFCNDCFPYYLHVKVTELSEYRQNPFLCPIQGCRAEMCIEAIVKQHISKEDVRLIERWKRDLEFPPCFLLDRCPSKSCATNNTDKAKDDDYMMRRCNNDVKNKFIFCEVCKKEWCELCMRRIHNGVSRAEHKEVCEVQMMLKFCRRYLRASDEMKQKCEEMYPWICNYSRGVHEDVGVLSWLLENGQNCPNCAVGVERISGCFHMTCPTCATHFCYECGQEIFYPFYGTHHCWEEQEMFEQFQ